MSGIDTIKYHTWPRTPHGEVTKTQTSQMRAKRSALSEQVTTRQQWTDAEAWQTQYINNTNDPQKKYRLGTVSKNILLEGLNPFHGANLTLVKIPMQGVSTYVEGHKTSHWRTNYSCYIFSNSHIKFRKGICLKTYAANSHAHLSCIGKQGKFSGSCLSTIY